MKELELYCIMCPASCTLRVIVKIERYKYMETGVQEE